jgi:hypothetical protein
MKLAVSHEEWKKLADEKKERLMSGTSTGLSEQDSDKLVTNELSKRYKQVNLSELEEDKYIWDTYPIEVEYNDAEKTSFKFFFCGYLQYYDQITRNGAIDHVLHFKWEKNLVTVYICPRPRRIDECPETCPPATLSSDPVPPKAPPPPY